MITSYFSFQEDPSPVALTPTKSHIHIFIHIFHKKHHGLNMTKISCCADKRRKKSLKKNKTKQNKTGGVFPGEENSCFMEIKNKKNITIGSNSSIFLEGGPSESSFPLSAAPGEKTIRGSKRFLTRAAVWLDDEDSGCNVYDYTYTYPTYLHIYMCIRKNI